MPSSLILIALLGFVSCFLLFFQCRSEKKFVQLIPQISAGNLKRTACDNKIYNIWELSNCNCNDYAGLSARLEFCKLKCPVDAEGKSDRCCKMRCRFSDFLVNNAKINVTAMTSLFGPVNDPKIVENIRECLLIGKIVFNWDSTTSSFFKKKPLFAVGKIPSSELNCQVSVQHIKTNFCTSWMNLAKCGNITTSEKCIVLQKLILKCFNYLKDDDIPVDRDPKISSREDEAFVRILFPSEFFNSFLRSQPWSLQAKSVFQCSRKHHRLTASFILRLGIRPQGTRVPKNVQNTQTYVA